MGKDTPKLFKLNDHERQKNWMKQIANKLKRLSDVVTAVNWDKY